MGKFIVHQNDANALEIKHALQRIGADVRGGDWVDYVVGFQGNTYLLEIKTRRGKLSELQRELESNWRGHYRIVRTVEEAFEAIGFKPVPVPGKH